LVEKHPGNVEVLQHLGLVLLKQKKFDAAARQLEAAVKLDAGNPLVWLSLAQARLETAQRQPAMEAAAEALRLAPEEPVVARALAMFFAQAGEFAKAAEQELRWARAANGDRQALERAAGYYLRANQPDPAIMVAREMESKGPSAPAQNILAQAYRLKREPAKAVAAFEEAIRLEPAKPALYAELAQLFLDHNTPEPARIVLEEAVRRFPQDVELRRLLGLACYAVGNTERALDEFIRVIEMEPDSALSYAALETLLPDSGNRLGVLVEKLRGFAKCHPDNALAHYLLALGIATGGGPTAETEALLRKAIEAQPSFWPAWFELHKILKGNERLEEAARALEQTLKLNPDHAPAHYSLAQVYLRLGDADRAARHRQRHHQLVLKDREETDRRRNDMPRLAYEIKPR
jgi:tetratricopeptide (TPR) repeat protein